MVLPWENGIPGGLARCSSRGLLQTTGTATGLCSESDPNRHVDGPVSLCT